ncbi:hypothetical protein [Flavobacterium ardleyense]|uniref:hypothetical protein n=1 Tax=Flavobacterium ardleyense TaxID=2038737 RepID=UPI00298D330D|nr:hypothetical protein [Flavobacterium ardleyense]
MKKTILQSFLLFTFLFLDFVAFAQNPGTDDQSGGLEGEDPVAPINGKLIWLALVGIAFAYYTYKNTRTVEISK